MAKSGAKSGAKSVTKAAQKDRTQQPDAPQLDAPQSTQATAKQRTSTRKSAGKKLAEKPPGKLVDAVDKAADKAAKSRKASKVPDRTNFPASLTLGDYALTLVRKQYGRLIKQEAGVLQDTDPECLHQMRVSSRRLRTVLQVFNQVVKLPKPAQAKRIQALAKVLGGLRDLDVQIAALREQYRPLISTAEQPLTDAAIERLQAKRQKVFQQVEQALTAAQYCELKSAYESWLAQPVYHPLAQLPLSAALPDLLAPLLSELLLHPGWWADPETDELTLHELRKTCKHARYQAEFFTDFYDADFQQWVDELKQLQEDLGVVQDAHVLLELLDLEPSGSPDLFQAIQQQRQQAMAGWDALRAKYTDGPFRYSLYQMTLIPT